jgi:NADPH-dependent 2,4-dienoyl-CoA reductase/sulfur reductase-like enzyme
MSLEDVRTSIAIVGAGQAAARAAQELRALGHAGTITLIGAEAHRPYERPPLSKAVLQGDGLGYTPVLSESVFAELQMDFIPATRVTSLHLDEHRLTLSDQRSVHYDRCLLATGGEVRVLPALPPGGLHTHYLRTIDDAQALRDRLRAGGSLAVIGGGFLGLEAAMSARQAGMNVTVIESAATLLGRFVPPDLSEWVASSAIAQGIDLHLGQALQSAQAMPEGVRLTLQDGSPLHADAVLVAIGLVPQVELARQAGLALDARDGGIAVAANGCSSHPDVFAAGDCASQFRPFLGVSARLESWQNANEQARVAAAGLLDISPPQAAFPWFWTDLGEHNLQMLGLKATDLNYVHRRLGADTHRGVWLGLRGGIPVHGVALNAGADLRALRTLLERQIPIDHRQFTDPTTKLKAWAQSQLAATAVPHS